MDRKKVYLAGAAKCYGTGSDNAYSWRNAVKSSIVLWDYDHVSIINPLEYYNYDVQTHKSEKEIFKFEMRKVKESDVVLVNLKDLDKSIGTSDEILYAYMNNVPIVGFLCTEEELNNEKLEEIIHPWKIYQIDRIETGGNAMGNAIDYIKNYYL